MKKYRNLIQHARKIKIRISETQQNITANDNKIVLLNNRLNTLAKNSSQQHDDKEQLSKEITSLEHYKNHNQQWRNTYGNITLGSIVINILASTPYLLSLGLTL